MGHRFLPVVGIRDSEGTQYNAWSHLAGGIAADEPRAGSQGDRMPERYLDRLILNEMRRILLLYCSGSTCLSPLSDPIVDSDSGINQPKLGEGKNAKEKSEVMTRECVDNKIFCHRFQILIRQLTI